MLVTTKKSYIDLEDIILEDIDSINWRSSDKKLWKKQDDIDLIKIYRTFSNNDLRYHLKKRFPDKTTSQCRARYDYAYAPHIKKYHLSENDKQYIIDNLEDLGMSKIAHDLEVSYYLIKNFARDNHRIKRTIKNINQTENQNLPKVPIVANLLEIPISKQMPIAILLPINFCYVFPIKIYLSYSYNEWIFIRIFLLSK
jgi:hypothetical protein